MQLTLLSVIQFSRNSNSPKILCCVFDSFKFKKIRFNGNRDEVETSLFRDSMTASSVVSGGSFGLGAYLSSHCVPQHYFFKTSKNSQIIYHVVL